MSLKFYTCLQSQTRMRSRSHTCSIYLHAYTCLQLSIVENEFSLILQANGSQSANTQPSAIIKQLLNVTKWSHRVEHMHLFQTALAGICETE